MSAKVWSECRCGNSFRKYLKYDNVSPGSVAR